MGARLYIIICLLCFLVACSSEEKNKVFLSLNKTHSTIEDTRFLMDKIEIIYGDTIFIKKTKKDHLFRSTFFRNGTEIFELRHRGWDASRISGMDSILTFSPVDTTFYYKSAFLNPPPTVESLSLSDCKYQIKKEDTHYVTIKQSLVDTTYKELFFYDENLYIYKYVNTYKGNTCIYE